MTAHDIIRQLEELEPAEVEKVQNWLLEHAEPTPQFLAGVEEGLRDFEQGRFRDYTVDELKAKVDGWLGSSR